MKKYLHPASICCFIIFLGIQLLPVKSSAQANVDFSAGNFSNWTGTWGPGTFCITAPVPAPTANAGFNQGVNNATPGSMPKKYQFIMTGGVDSLLQAYGYTCPVVWPGGTSAYSARIGTSHAYGEGESISYQFLVTTNNCNFTYHYAVSLGNGTGGHLTEATQPYFDISMVDGSNNAITCAEYKVDGLSAGTIPGFINIPASVTGNGDAVYYHPWTSVFVPLNAYIGQTVKITFTTAACSPFCGGSHWAYAYLSADVAPLQIVSPSPTICGSSTLRLTAPTGAATYAWTGPGVIAPTDSPSVLINQPGTYHVSMTTFGTNPCTFSLDTTITLSANVPSAKFSTPGGCSGSTVAFTDLSTPVGQVTWAWDFNNDGVTDATTQNPSYIFPGTGTFPVKLTVNWGTCSADTTINVVIGPVPTSTFTALPNSVCAGQVVNINYTGNGIAGDTYTWGFDGGTVISGTNAGPYQVNWSTGGTKNITLTVSAGSCASGVTTVPITVTPFPGLTVSNDTAVCPGKSAQLSVSGATSYSWAPAGSLSSATAANVVATPATTTTYTVTGNTSSCTVTDVITVRIINPPTSLFTVASPSVCVGQNDVITFTGTASPAATYTWAFTGDTSATESGRGPFTFNVSTSGSESISLVVVDSGCNSAITTLPITINPTPSSAFSVVSPVCVGQNSTITYTGNAPGAPTYTWNFSGGTVASGSNAGPYQVNWGSAGTEPVTLTVTSNGCSSNTSNNVVVETPPTSSFTVAPTSVCAFQNSTITFNGTASPNANYQWNFSGATIVSGSNAGPYVVNWATAGTQNVTLSVTDGACASGLTTQTVTVSPTPTAAFTVTNPVCFGQNSNVAYTGTGTGADSYNWTFGAGGTIVSGNGQGPFVISWPAPGNEHITLTVSGNGCTSPVADSVVVINPVPYASINATSPVCAHQNSSITFNGTASNTAVYSWSFSGDSTFTQSAPGPFTLNISTSGTENIELSITDNGCNSNDTTVSVTISPIPVSNAGGPTVAFCSGDSAALGAAPVAGYTYSWSPTAGLSNPTIANPYADGTNNTTATIVTQYVLTTSSGTCSSTASVVDSIYPSAVASFTPPAGQCYVPANSFNFSAGGSFIPSAASFSWNFGTNGVPATATSQNAVVSFSAPGIQTVSLTISQLGCPSSTFTSTVNVYAVPIVYFNATPLTGCQPLRVCFTDSTTPNNSGATYIWDFGNGQTSNLQNPCITYADSGVYSVQEAVITANGCAAIPVTRNNLINVSGKPFAAFTPTDATIQLPVDNITLTNLSVNATSYQWNFGVLGTSTAINPTLTFALPGSYPVELIAQSQQGCVDSTSGRIIVLPPTNYFVPNVFTPNGDGRNDEFYIEAQEGITVYKFEIFDRWGEMVHSGLYPWDGTYKGKPCPEGVYIYAVQLGQAGQEKAIMRKGSVTLLR